MVQRRQKLGPGYMEWSRLLKLAPTCFAHKAKRGVEGKRDSGGKENIAAGLYCSSSACCHQIGHENFDRTSDE